MFLITYNTITCGLAIRFPFETLFHTGTHLVPLIRICPSGECTLAYEMLEVFESIYRTSPILSPISKNSFINLAIYSIHQINYDQTIKHKNKSFYSCVYSSAIQQIINMIHEDVNIHSTIKDKILYLKQLHIIGMRGYMSSYINKYIENLVEILMCDICARKIQKQFRLAISHPDYILCKNRLMDEFDTFSSI